MAAAVSDEIVHPEMDLVFTIDEEDGMTGAKALTPESFGARTLLNLDSEEDGMIYIGCAGGTDTIMTCSHDMVDVPADMQLFEVSVSGLRGGHSGCEIHLPLGNAIKVMTEIIHSAVKGDFYISEINGGAKT